MPGDGLTHGPPATKKAGGSHHRISRTNRHSLRDGVTAYIALSLGTGLSCPHHRRDAKHHRRLSPSVGRPGPHDFAVRVRHVRPTCHPRPPHPRPTYRDDRPKRPSSSRRDGREHRRDLPDGASAETCGRLARRAVCAWRACGNCLSGKCVHDHSGRRCRAGIFRRGSCDRRSADMAAEGWPGFGSSAQRATLALGVEALLNRLLAPGAAVSLRGRKAKTGVACARPDGLRDATRSKTAGRCADHELDWCERPADHRGIGEFAGAYRRVECPSSFAIRDGLLSLHSTVAFAGCRSLECPSIGIALPPGHCQRGLIIREGSHKLSYRLVYRIRLGPQSRRRRRRRYKSL